MFNGSSTQKGACVGVDIYSPCGRTWRFVCKLEDQAFNNQVEYETLIMGLRILETMKAQDVEIKRGLLANNQAIDW